VVVADTAKLEAIKQFKLPGRDHKPTPSLNTRRQPRSPLMQGLIEQLLIAPRPAGPDALQLRLVVLEALDENPASISARNILQSWPLWGSPPKWKRQAHVKLTPLLHHQGAQHNYNRSLITEARHQQDRVLIKIAPPLGGHQGWRKH